MRALQEEEREHEKEEEAGGAAGGRAAARKARRPCTATRSSSASIVACPRQPQSFSRAGLHILLSTAPLVRASGCSLDIFDGGRLLEVLLGRCRLRQRLRIVLNAAPTATRRASRL